MTRALICTGVLGGGTAVVFALALAVSLLFPQGSLVPAGWNGGWTPRVLPGDLMVQQGWIGPGLDRVPVVALPAPVAPAPAIEVPAPAVTDSCCATRRWSAACSASAAWSCSPWPPPSHCSSRTGRW